MIRACGEPQFKTRIHGRRGGGIVMCDALMKSLLSALHVDALPTSVLLVSRLRLPSHRTQPHVYPYVVMLY